MTRARACTGPVTWRAGGRTGCSNISAELMNRSSSVGTASNLAILNRSSGHAMAATRCRRCTQRQGGRRLYLAAFVVPDDADASLDLIGIKAQISGELPDYMIPSTIDQIEFVPLSPAGKVDRRLLPEPVVE